MAQSDPSDVEAPPLQPAADQPWPDEVAGLVESARRACAQDRRDDAAEPIVLAFAKVGWDPELLERLAALARELGIVPQVLQSLGAGTGEDAERWYAFARAQRHLASAALAVESFRRAVQLEPTALGWFELADAAATAADFATAVHAYREAAHRSESAADRMVALSLLVHLLVREGDLDAALAEHEALEAARRESDAEREPAEDQGGEATLRLVEALLDAERADETRRLLESAPSGDARQPLARALALARGRLAVLDGALPAALEAFEQARPPAERHAVVWRFWYAVALERSGRLAEAEPLLREAESMLPAGEAAASMLPQVRARVLFGLGRADEARAVLSGIDADALTGLPRAQTLLLRGVDALNRGEPATALEQVTAAQEHAPPALLPEVTLWRAAALNALGKPREALELLASSADALRAHAMLAARWAQETAQARSATGDTAGAIETLAHAIETTRDSTPRAVLALMRARILPARSAAESRDAYAVAIRMADAAPPDAGRPMAIRSRIEGAAAALAATDLETANRWAFETVQQARPEDGEVWSAARTLASRIAIARGAAADAVALLRELRERDEGARRNADVLALAWQAMYAAEGADAVRRWLDGVAAELGPAQAPVIELLRGETELRGGDLAGAQCHYALGAQLPAGASGDSGVVTASLMCALGTADPRRVLELVEQVGKERPLQGEWARLEAFRAIALANLGRYDEAKRGFAQGIARDDPLAPLFDLTYAQTLNATGEYAEALGVLDGLGSRLDVGGTDPALPMQARIQRSVALLGLDRASEAIAAADAALPYASQGGAAALLAPLAKVQRAFALHRTGKSEQALEALQALDAERPPAEGPLAPLAELALLGHARVLYDLDREEECLALCERAIAMDLPGPSAQEMKGDALLVLQDYPGALAAYEKALERARSDEERFDPLSGQGRAWHRLADLERAVACYRRALALRCRAAQRDWVVMFRLAESYEALGRERPALGAYRQAWARYRGKRRPASIALGISACLLRLNQPADALRFLEKEAPAAEKDPRLQHNRALALAHTGERARALAAARDAAAQGVAEAKGLVESLAPRPASRSAWLDYWFDTQASTGRRALAVLLLATAGAALALPFIAALRAGTLDWKAALPLAVLALALLLLPAMKQLSVGIGDVKLQLEPASSSGGDRVEAPIRLPAPIGMGAFTAAAAPAAIGARDAIAAASPGSP
jgi:tetratricopeptide (TPR) repeat protein